MKIHVNDTETSDTQTYEGVDGWSLMEVLRDYGLPIKAECGGACCCATCHVYVSDEWLDKLPEIGPDEEDMLDVAPNVTDNSRLSCQIILDESLDGMNVEIVKID